MVSFSVTSPPTVDPSHADSSSAKVKVIRAAVAIARDVARDLPATLEAHLNGVSKEFEAKENLEMALVFEHIASIAASSMRFGRETALAEARQARKGRRMTKNVLKAGRDIHDVAVDHSVVEHTEVASPRALGAQDSVEALREEVGELFAFVADRLEDLEAAPPPTGSADVLRDIRLVLSNLEKQGTLQAATLKDVLTMLEPMWTDAMKAKFSTLDQVLRVSGKALPAIVKMISAAAGAG